jgi:hypothetical protein
VVQEVPAKTVDISSEKATEKAVFEDHINMKETAEKADITEDAAENIASVRNCTRCGKSTKGHPGPCGTRCSNITNSPEQLRSSLTQGEKIMTPVKELCEESNNHNLKQSINETVQPVSQEVVNIWEHSDEEFELSKDRKRRKEWQCKWCEKSYEKKDGLRYHIQVKHREHSSWDWP